VGAWSDFDELLRTGYEYVVESGRWDRDRLSEITGAPAETVDRAREALVDLRVIEPARAREGWRAVSPRLAMAKLVLPIEAEVRRRAAHAEGLRERLRMLLPVHEAEQDADAVDIVQTVTEPDELTRLIGAEISDRGTELALMRPRAEHPLLADWYLDTQARGARVRTIHQHAARYHLPTAGLVDLVSSPRAEFRTAAELPLQLLLVDRRMCVLMSADDPAGAEQPVDEVAVVLRHPFAVAQLAAVFEEAWTRAGPFTPADPQPAWVGDDTRRSILQLLATGAKDEAVARRLGVSIRTCRRHVAELMAALGVHSRFQGGVEAVRRGLL
jgi:DNA-binding CsgD family transcriptional regulator